jgi:arylformamidase
VTLIDLTHPFGEGIYNLPGCPPLKLHRFATIAKDGLNDTEASFTVHTGTHIDAPNHVFDDRRGMDQVTLDELCGPAVGWSVDLGPGDVIGVDLLEQQSPELERGDRVFVHTGWGRLFATREHERYRVHPYLSDEAAHWLVDRGARMLATDTPTPDLPGPLRTQGFNWPVHHILMRNDVLIVENAANLDKVVGRRFRVYALPLPIVGSDASPARIVAELPP